MNADDVRHGSTRGYAAGCRDACCRIAMSRYDKRRKMAVLATGSGFSVDATGARRRIEALMALGWSADALAGEAGWGHRNNINRIRTCKWLERKTYEAIVILFDRLCMTPGGSSTTRSRALRAGYLPPLAWDDIDNDPHPAQKISGDDDDPNIDPVLVDRAVEGMGFAGYFTKAEKQAVVARWQRLDRSLADLARLSGWNVHRYTATESDVAA